MRFLTLFFTLMIFGSAVAQRDTVAKQLELPTVYYDQDFELHYQQQLNLIRRTYPIALKAKEIIDSLDAEIADVNSKRKQKKLAKETKKDLKEEFEYLLKDLYVGEGAMLFKLIHRETDMTVTEILEKYKGKLYAGTVHATFALYGHDTDSEFRPKNEDWIAELVIQDIQSGKLKVDLELPDVSKKDYKDGMKEYRDYRREQRKKKRKKD